MPDSGSFKPSPPPSIGPVLRELRQDRSWTLEELSQKSGVSASMLSEIERSSANPTFATLWNLTQALDVEISELTKGSRNDKSSGWIELSPASRTPAMKSDDGLVSLKILGPVELVDVAEWYVLEAQPGGRLLSAPHASGTVEHLTVMSGELTVQSGSVVERVTTDATARYPADTDHEIRNHTTSDAVALLVVINRKAS